MKNETCLLRNLPDFRESFADTSHFEMVSKRGEKRRRFATSSHPSRYRRVPSNQTKTTSRSLDVLRRLSVSAARLGVYTFHLCFRCVQRDFHFAFTHGTNILSGESIPRDARPRHESSRSVFDQILDEP